MYIIDPHFDCSVLTNTKKKIKLTERMDQFIAVHCHERHYSFPIKKGNIEGCCCGKPILPEYVFIEVNHLLDPVPSPTNNEKYKTFAESFGNVPVDVPDKDLP